MEIRTHCAKCGAPKIAAKECPKCGVIYAKVEQGKKGNNSNLVSCSACGKEISINAKLCPHCGEPRSQPKKPLKSKELSSFGSLRSLFRMVGIMLLIGGIFTTCYYYFKFDTSVATDLGTRVHNIGLLNQRQTGIMFSIALAVLGTVLMFFGRDSTIGIGSTDRECPHCGETIKRSATVCRFCNGDIVPS